MVTALDLAGRIDVLREAPEYRTYEYVRERVLRMKEREADRRSGIHEPSDYWREDLTNFDYMLDASPLIVRKLRHHCYHITGIRVYDYRSNKDDARRRFEAKLRSVAAVGGKELLVPEPPALGGFGFTVDGGLYNIDTLKYYEVLIGMREGAILDEFRGATERRVVWEIGAGWGGFAYQFKTLCPNTTYIISDFPELFLFSAVYLMTLFPGARVAFYGAGSDDELGGRWRDADFVFVPNTLLDAVRPERLDLTVNMVSFQEMTTEQVEAYVRHAFELGCPYLYSLNRDRSPYNPQLTSVRSIIRRHYWSHEMAIMPVSYGALGDRPGPDRDGYSGKYMDRPDLDYKHVLGWKRMLA